MIVTDLIKLLEGIRDDPKFGPETDIRYRELNGNLGKIDYSVVPRDGQGIALAEEWM